MIEKMNKYAYLVYHKEYDVFLERLRALGVVHVRSTKPTQDHPIMQQLKVEDKRIKTQLDYLDKLLKAEAAKPAVRAAQTAEPQGTGLKTAGAQTAGAQTVGARAIGSQATGTQLAETQATGSQTAASQTAGTQLAGSQTSGSQLVPQLLSREESERVLIETEQLREKLGKIQMSLTSKIKESESFYPWGDFSYANIERLRQAGYQVTFFSCPESRYDESWEEASNALIVNRRNSTVYFITITTANREVLIDADRVKMPVKDFQQLSAEIKQERRNREETEAALLTIAQQYYGSLQQLKAEIENETAWNQVLIQTEAGADQKLMLLEGWVPMDKTAEMEAMVTDAGYYCQPLEITDEDVIPIKLKNNKFTQLFEPITRLYSLPNYKEFDPTPLFAPFFMLFFGLCLGDGGYGLLLIVAALILKKKLKEDMKPFASMVLYFGVMTLVIGVLTGTFFGVSLLDIEAFSAVRSYFITSDNLMIISLVIGFFHVIYAKVIAAIKMKIQRGVKYSLSSFAWIFVILALAAIFVLPLANIHLSKPVEYTLYGVAILCGAVALFYNSPGKNIFLNFGSGLWDTYNMVTGLVGDVLSYIRLYAIGLTSALLGGVFNTMAIDMTASMNPFVRWLPMLLILLIGHALNIGLSLISSLVHPIRLVYVEYYKNSEFEGGGADYKPFKKI